ncbi:MAG: double zinc ribbon domain-containing protein, partial [Planctomycetota bacterium]
MHRMWSKAKKCSADLLHRILPYYQAGGHLLWPGRCLICNISVLPADEGLCKSCWQDLSKA